MVCRGETRVRRPSGGCCHSVCMFLIPVIHRHCQRIRSSCHLSSLDLPTPAPAPPITSWEVHLHWLPPLFYFPLFSQPAAIWLLPPTHHWNPCHEVSYTFLELTQWVIFWCYLTWPLLVIDSGFSLLQILSLPGFRNHKYPLLLPLSICFQPLMELFDVSHWLAFSTTYCSCSFIHSIDIYWALPTCQAPLITVNKRQSLSFGADILV